MAGHAADVTLPGTYASPYASQITLSTTGTANPLPESVATVSVIKDLSTMSLINAAGITGTNPLPMTTFVGEPGEHYHFPAYRLTDPDSDSGLYGLWAEALATGPNFAGDAANPSAPFLIVLNYGITDEDQYHIGAARLAAVPVPEPSTLALCGAAFAAAGWRWRHSLVRRRDRRPRS